MDRLAAASIDDGTPMRVLSERAMRAALEDLNLFGEAQGRLGNGSSLLDAGEWSSLLRGARVLNATRGQRVLKKGDTQVIFYIVFFFVGENPSFF